MKPIFFVTGGSKGIGAATVRMAAQRGYRVAFTYSTSADAAHALCAQIDAQGGTAMAIDCDVRHGDQVKATFEKLAKDWGRPDAVFVNAGITGPMARIDALQPHELDVVLKVNLYGSFYTCMEATKRMARCHVGAGGAIVLMSSRAAQLGGAGEWIHYAASKGAIDSMTWGLSKEWAGENIRVNAVAPGLIDTDIQQVGDGKRLERLLPFVPMGRIGGPEEVAETVLWLASPSSSYVSGAIIPISGAR